MNGSTMSAKTAPPKRIPPFVPVKPQDRTALYSAKELGDLSANDARNELDELSEPHRSQRAASAPKAPKT
jgi:hypothetical protein